MTFAIQPKHIAANLEEINSDLAPYLQRLHQHPGPDFTVEELYSLREHLLHIHANVKLLSIAVDDAEPKPKRRIRLPFKK